ncbi:MAG: CBS domain-containing protein [Planctomycetota bacterium]|jgi:CBS domain-containing protein
MKNSQLSYLDLAHEIAASLGISLPPMCITADVMTRKIKFLTLDHTVSDFLEFMKKNKVRHVAIFDPPSELYSKPFFVGIVSERDVLRFTLPYAAKTIGAPEHKKAMKKLLVQLVTRKPICVSPDTPVPQLISVMIDNHIDMVPVLDDTELVGIITNTDILKLVVTFDTAVRKLSQTLRTTACKDSADTAALNAWIDRTASRIMTDHPFCLALNDPLEKAISLLKKKGLRHVLVTDKNNRLVGIVSDRDVLRYLPYADTRPGFKPKAFRDRLFSIPSDTPGMDIPLAHIMEWELVCITDDSPVADAAKKLQSEKISCLPVLDADRNLCGIVTVTDLMCVLLNAYKTPESSNPEL